MCFHLIILVEVTRLIRFAVGAIIMMENDFLLVKKQTVETLTGKHSIAYEIDFVKCGLENEESNEAALLRELYEETGSKDYQIIEQINQKLHFSFPNDLAKKIGYSHQQTTFFLVRYTGKTKEFKPIDCEIQSILFVSKDELIDTLTHQETKTFIQQLHYF